MNHFLDVIDRLRELQDGKLNLPPETLRDLDRFFRDQILNTDELTEHERGIVLEHYLRTAA